MALDPNALVTAGSSVLGAALKSEPSFAQASSQLDAVFDNSGWTVNFGDNATQNTERSQLPAVGGGINTTIIIVAVCALVAWKLYVRSQKR